MRHRTEAHLPGRCPRCWLKEALCLCPQLPRVSSSAQFVVVRHVLEGRKSTNTARIGALAMERCALWAYDGPDPALDAQLAALPNAWLLFPGGELPSSVPAIDHLVVLDGTWRQARKMVRKLPALSRLPRLSLPPPATAPQRLRHSDDERNMSTLEAMAMAVGFLEGSAHAQPLLELHRELVQRVLIGRGRPRSQILGAAPVEPTGGAGEPNG